jgi:hypothetical protein
MSDSTSEFEGRVLYANGFAAQGVRVRIFDKDAPGKGDDDLTESPGLSDANGRFTIRFNLDRFQDYNSFNRIELLGVNIDWSSLARNVRLPDFSDEYLPFLQFEYTHEGQAHTHTAPLGHFQYEFRLPQSVPLRFTPSIHAFKFLNNFPGYPLPFSVPALPGTGKVSPAYGLCGGMSSASYDFFLAGREIPRLTKAPRSGTRMHRYLYRRAMDTFGSFGESLLKVAGWMRIPEGGVTGSCKRTLDEFNLIRSRLDAQHAVVLALVYVGADTLPNLLKQIWNNHQVLAHSWTQAAQDAVELQVYDPNYPLRDDVVIRGERIPVGVASDPEKGQAQVFGLRCVQKVGNQVVRPVRGFFPMPYVQVEPPKDLV